MSRYRKTFRGNTGRTKQVGYLQSKLNDKQIQNIKKFGNLKLNQMSHQQLKR